MRQETRKIERSPEERARLAAIRKRFASRPSLRELSESGDFGPPIPGQTFWAVMALVKQLRSAREAANLSLADLADRTGMDKGFLSRLETGKQGNPTIDTLARYAHALGKRMEFGIVDIERKPGHANSMNGSAPAVKNGERKLAKARRPSGKKRAERK